MASNAYILYGDCNNPLFCGGWAMEVQTVKDFKEWSEYPLLYTGCNCREILGLGNATEECDLRKYRFKSFEYNFQIVNYWCTDDCNAIDLNKDAGGDGNFETLTTQVVHGGGVDCGCIRNGNNECVPTDEPPCDDPAISFIGDQTASYNKQIGYINNLNEFPITSDPTFPTLTPHCDDQTCSTSYSEEDGEDKTGTITTSGGSTGKTVTCNWQTPYRESCNNFEQISYAENSFVLSGGVDATDPAIIYNELVSPHKTATLPNDWKNRICGNPLASILPSEYMAINTATFESYYQYCLEEGCDHPTLGGLGYINRTFSIDHSKKGIRWRFPNVRYMNLWICEWITEIVYSAHAKIDGSSMDGFSVSVISQSIDNVTIDRRNSSLNFSVCKYENCYNNTPTLDPVWINNETPSYILDPLNGIEQETITFGSGEIVPCDTFEYNETYSAKTIRIAGAAIVGISLDEPKPKNPNYVPYKPPLYKFDGDVYQCRVYNNLFVNATHFCPYAIPTDFNNYSTLNNGFDAANEEFFNNILNVNTCGAP